MQGVCLKKIKRERGKRKSIRPTRMEIWRAEASYGAFVTVRTGTPLNCHEHQHEEQYSDQCSV